MEKLFSISSRLPLVLALLIIILSSSLWYLDFYADQQRVFEDHEDFNQHLADRIETEILDRVIFSYNILVNEILANDSLDNPLVNQSHYEGHISPLFQLFDEYQTINWVNTSGYVKLVYPYNENKVVVNQSLMYTADGNLNIALDTANRTKTIQSTSFIPFFQGNEGIAVYLPIIENDTILGFMNILIKMKVLIENSIGEEDNLEMYKIKVSDENDTEILIFDGSRIEGNEYIQRNEITFFNQNWTLTSQLSAKAISEVSLFRNMYILIIGVFFAIFAGFSAQLLIRQNVIQEERFEEQQQYEKLINRYEKINALGTMAGGLAHDFNNLLMSISGNLSILKLLLEDNGSEEINMSLKAISDTIEKSKDLTQQILIFSRQSEIESAHVDIFEILKDTITIFDSVRPKTVELRTNFNHTFTRTTANYSRLSQSFLNIMNNALDALPNKKGYIEINTWTLINQDDIPERLKSVQDLDLVSGYFQIDFIDSGVGIEISDVEHIFDPFFTTKDTGKGTGLGLSIVYQYLTSIGGDIMVNSKAGLGTKFSMYIPLIELDGLEDYPTETKQIVPKELGFHFQDILGRKPTVLLVEDESDIAKSLTKLLKIANVDVIVASDGTTGITKYQNQKENSHIDLVISDINLPGMSGVELAHKIQKIHPKQVIIFITGFNETRITEEMMTGDYIILQKPFNQQDLYQAINTVMGLNII